MLYAYWMCVNFIFLLHTYNLLGDYMIFFLSHSIFLVVGHIIKSLIFVLFLYWNSQIHPRSFVILNVVWTCSSGKFDVMHSIHVVLVLLVSPCPAFILGHQFLKILGANIMNFGNWVQLLANFQVIYIKCVCVSLDTHIYVECVLQAN